MAESTGAGKMVCVTGASGFVGSHLVRQLLEKGYTVRGTVRDAGNEEKTGWIRDLAQGTPGTLELVSANLDVPGSYDAAVEGCVYVCHVAASLTLKARDPQKDIVDPALEGTRNVLNSILKAKCAERVVVTSSIATLYEYPLLPDHVYTENDWNSNLSMDDPYPVGKTLAEKLAWQVYEEQPAEGWRFELVTVCPGGVLGEVYNKQHLQSTPQMVHSLLAGKLPMCPNIYWNLVDVHDVALAHIRVLENSEAKGRYTLVNGDCWSMPDIAAVLREEYPEAKIPTRRMPDWMAYAVATVHPTMSWSYLRKSLGITKQFSNEKAKSELGIDFRTSKESILTTAKSIMKLNLL